MCFCESQLAREAHTLHFIFYNYPIRHCITCAAEEVLLNKLRKQRNIKVNSSDRFTDVPSLFVV
jgi:hypothetical protein